MVIQNRDNIGFQMQEMVTTLTQDSIAAFVISYLKKHQIPYAQNMSDDIFYFDHLDAPLVCCCMDGLANLDGMSLLYHLEWEHTPLLTSRETIIKEDELGVILQLKMLQKYPNLNFIFSRKGRNQDVGFGDLVKDEVCILE